MRVGLMVNCKWTVGVSVCTGIASVWWICDPLHLCHAPLPDYSWQRIQPPCNPDQDEGIRQDGWMDGWTPESNFFESTFFIRRGTAAPQSTYRCVLWLFKIFRTKFWPEKEPIAPLCTQVKGSACSCKMVGAKLLKHAGLMFQKHHFR